MGIHIVLRPHWIGLGVLVASLIGTVPGAVHAQSPSVNLQCVVGTLLLGDTQAADTVQPTCGQMYSEHEANVVIVSLQDGTVLVAGGFVSSTPPYGAITAEAEIYHPHTGIFTQVGAMPIKPQRPQAVLLGNGQVLVAEGAAGSAVYMPLLLKFSQVGPFVGAQPPAPEFTLTAFGKTSALVAGGQGYRVAQTGAEVYNASSKTYTVTGSLNQGRSMHRAVQLADGRVLVLGGLVADGNGTFIPTATAELYDPATGKFTFTGSMGTARVFPAVIRLPDGRVLVAGGETNPFAQPYQQFASAELYDPASGRFGVTGSMAGPSCCIQPFLNKSGKAVVGGETYDPAAGTFSGVAGQPNTPDSFAVLQTGQLLIPNYYLNSTQPYLYQPPR